MFWLPHSLVSQIKFIEMTPPPQKKKPQTNKHKKKERESGWRNMNNAELNVNQIDILNGH